MHLSTPGLLSKNEWECIRRCPALGAREETSPVTEGPAQRLDCVTGCVYE